jgi:hypothetical protein
VEISPKRKDSVENARQAWIKRLIDLSRRNNLLYFRPLKLGTLALSLTKGSKVADLLRGDAVAVAELVEDPRQELLYPKLLEIWRRSQENAEEKGLATMFMSIGMATWKASDDGRPPEAPILLLPTALEYKGRAGLSFSLKRTGPIQVNLVLLHVLDTEFRIKLAPDDLLLVMQGDDEGEAFDPSDVYQLLSNKCRQVPDFQTKNDAILGNFAFQKMAMVNDLLQNRELLITHDVIAALAGDTDARVLVGSTAMDPDPRELDKVPPEMEFLILDADSSQQRAITAVLSGQSAVIHGPPGTGKSQTIANLIASLAASGKRTLFVAEKRAALEVVHKRLKQVGLEHVAIDLHGADVSPKRVLEQVAASLDAVRKAPLVNCEQMHQQFIERRERLNRHVERLHKRREPSGKTVYELQGLVLKLENEARSEIRWRGPELLKIQKAGLQNVRDLLKEASGLAPLFLRTDPSPWTGGNLPDGNAAQRAMELAGLLANQTWPEFLGSLFSLTQAVHFTRPATLTDAKSLFTLLSGVQNSLLRYSVEIYRQDLPALIHSLQAGKAGGLTTIWAWCTKSDFRRGRRVILNLRTAGKCPVEELLKEITAAQEQKLQWADWCTDATTPKEVPNYSTHRQTFDLAMKGISELEPLLPNRGLRQLPLDELGRLIESLAKDRLTPPKLPRLWQIERGLERAGVEGLVKEIRTTKPISSRWVTLFDHAWYVSSLEAAMAEDPEIASFNGRTHDDFVREFATLDKERIHIAATRVSRAYAQLCISAMNQHPEQEYLVRGEAQKKRRLMPLRTLFSQAKEVLTAVCPCWMASPLSVSQLLAAGKHFDYVIFDEASQVLPEDAVPAIMRGTHLIVAGDSKQLPPTAFFSVTDHDDPQEEELATAIEGFESLLDMTKIFVHQVSLEWHYRSRDETLITFSNHHLYGDRLVTFPGPGGAPAVQHILVQQPLGVDGQEESSSVEVRRVVELILKHAETRPDESLGVIAMGIRHADRVQRALDQALAGRSDLDAFFDPGAQERFFVKNLERVQGDERDATILTVGYGKDRGGNLPFRFGPLLSQGGQRRLNVAVTRARTRMTLVSSFGHMDMDQAKVKPGTGVELLRNYLIYASTGGKQLADVITTGFPMNDFEAQVSDILQSKGIPLIPQVGASRFRIDLVAQHPQQPGRFVLAIECDGASYHSSPTARDRDRLRQQQLQNLGWKFHRIWSTDWYMRKEEEIERALVAYKNAVEIADAAPSEAAATRQPQASAKTADRVPNAGLRSRSPRPNIPTRPSIDGYTQTELLAMINWIESDGRLRTHEELIEALVPVLGFQRRGARIESVLRSLLEQRRLG